MRFANSFGAKLAMVCAACLALLAVTAAGLNTVSVKALQENVLRNSLLLAEEKGKQLAKELARLESETGFLSMENPEQSPAREMFRSFIRNNDDIFMTGVFDQSGVILKESRDENPGGGFNLDLSDGIQNEISELGEDGLHKLEIEPPPSDMPLRIPLGLEKRPGIFLGVALREDSEIYRQIEADSQEITRRVAAWTAILSAALILAFAAVWVLFGQQVRLLRENEKLNRMAYVGTLASGLAHEIRNPLNAMSINLEVAEEDLDDPRDDSPQRVRQIVSHLRAEVGQLDGALNNFLMFAIPRKGQRQEICLVQAVRDALESLESELKSRNVKTSLDLRESLVVNADPTGVRQVFHNIVLNAVQAMGGPVRRLSVKARGRKGVARMEFEDTGVGIAAEQREEIFEAFQTSKPGGSGFGLPIARRIVNEHGGKIWAEAASGKGARIVLEFPLPKNGESG